jgi:lipoyl-dependent peroxiredoxin
MKRIASAIWKVGLKEGTGILSTESGVLKSTPFSAKPSFPGHAATNPEELLAAAVASSFALALFAELEKAFLIPENIRLAAVVMLEKSEGGQLVKQIHLDLTVKLANEDWDKFEAAAKAAKKGCTISSLLEMKVTLDAKLESMVSFGEIEGKSGSVPLGKRLVTIPVLHSS